MTDDREAKQDISEVLIRYSTGIDRRDWALLRTCFTAQCHIDYEGIGIWESADAITDFMAESHADMGHTMHRMTNMAITVSGDTGEARTYVDAILMAADGASGLNPIGFYDDHLLRTRDGWRIARRHYTMVSFRTVAG
jgi:3-phenylpropionate/cinnamic acid dioxygenase small subunit